MAAELDLVPEAGLFHARARLLLEVAEPDARHEEEEGERPEEHDEGEADGHEHDGAIDRHALRRAAHALGDLDGHVLHRQRDRRQDDEGREEHTEGEVLVEGRAGRQQQQAQRHRLDVVLVLRELEELRPGQEDDEVERRGEEELTEEEDVDQRVGEHHEREGRPANSKRSKHTRGRSQNQPPSSASP